MRHNALFAASALALFSPGELSLPLIPTAAAADSLGTSALTVSRGDVTDRLVLTGELDAASAASLVVPRTSQWVIQLRWLEVDGTAVKAGQKVADFDNSAFVADLSEKKLGALQAASDLEKQRAQDGLTTADKAFEVEKARTAMESARLSAALDKESLPARDWQENQLEFERQTTAFEKAKDDLESQTKSASLDVRVKQIALDKSLREIESAEGAIRDLELRAPRDGVVVIANHPREGRKLEIGDSIWVTVPVVRLPDMSTILVSAWLSDEDEGRVALGMQATCTLDAYPDTHFRGIVKELSPVAREPSEKSQRRSFRVTIALDDHATDRMLPGLSVKVEIAGRSVKDALVAPRAALDFDETPAKLRVAKGAPLAVRVGLCDGQRCEVKGAKGDEAALRPGLVLSRVKGAD